MSDDDETPQDMVVDEPFGYGDTSVLQYLSFTTTKIDIIIDMMPSSPIGHPSVLGGFLVEDEEDDDDDNFEPFSSPYESDNNPFSSSPESGSDHGSNSGGWEDSSDDEDDNYDVEMMEEILSTATDAHHLTQAQLDAVRPAMFKLQTGLSARAYNQLPATFPKHKTPGWKKAQKVLAQLAAFEKDVRHCCINSCVLFAGPHQDRDTCPKCKEPRYDTSGPKPRARKLWTYLPLAPRLKQMVENDDTRKEMQYRHQHDVACKHRADEVCDVFDTKLYCTLLERQVIVNGKTYNHHYFDQPTNIALGFSTDGVAIWKKQKASAWPLFAINYNLPPEKRMHRKHILCVGCVPKKAWDFESYMYPLYEEAVVLAIGVLVYEDWLTESFMLRAYFILAIGDILAISLIMHVKGHNGLYPCRLCEIMGIAAPDTAKPLYVPLDRSKYPQVREDRRLHGNARTLVDKYKPLDLPMRTEASYAAQLARVKAAPNKTTAKKIAQVTGINGESILNRFPGILISFLCSSKLIKY